MSDPTLKLVVAWSDSRNPVYPVVLAAVLDALAEADGSYAGAAKKVGTTTSQLLKFLRADREAWRALSEGRPRK